MKFLKGISLLSLLIIVVMFAWNNLAISEQVHDVDSFRSIYVNGPINLYLIKSQSESIMVRADDNVHEKVNIKVSNDHLEIFNSERITHERVLDVFVSFVELDSVHASGASTLTGKSLLDVSNFFIHASGASEIKLRLNADSLGLNMEGAANVQLAGQSNIFNLLINHVGDLMAYNLEVQHCTVVVDTGKQSPGIARVNVVQTLDATIRGPRNINYKGNPDVVKLIEGTGKILRF